MKIVLITGSCGLVGSEAVNFFIKKKFKVLGIDNNLRKFFFGEDGSTLWVQKKLIKYNKRDYGNCFKSGQRRPITYLE